MSSLGHGRDGEIARRRKTSGRNDDAGTENPQLTVSREELEDELRERNAKGEELHSIPITTPDQLEEAHSKYLTWTEYNEELLRRRFTTSKVADEYRLVSRPIVMGGYPSLHDRIKRHHDDIDYKLRKLESILDRLTLFEEPEAPGEATSPRQARTSGAGGGTSIFVVHGHDVSHKEQVARFLEQLVDLEVVILHEQANEGRTIIEKFVDHAGTAAFAVILLTGDDRGRENDDNATENLRGRQNVVFEMGFFIGALGRSRVAVLYQEGVERPSDMSGVLYSSLDDRGAWRADLAKELNAAQIPIDPRALL